MRNSYIDKFRFTHKNGEIHLAAHLYTFCIIYQASVDGSRSGFWQLHRGMLIHKIVCRNGECRHVSSDILSEILIITLLHASLILPLIIGKSSIHEFYRDDDIFIGAIGRLETDVFFFSRNRYIFDSLFCWPIAKIYLYLRQISVRLF